MSDGKLIVVDTPELVRDVKEFGIGVLEAYTNDGARLAVPRELIRELENGGKGALADQLINWATDPANAAKVVYRSELLDQPTIDHYKGNSQKSDPGLFDSAARHMIDTNSFSEVVIITQDNELRTNVVHHGSGRVDYDGSYPNFTPRPVYDFGDTDTALNGLHAIEYDKMRADAGLLTPSEYTLINSRINSEAYNTPQAKEYANIRQTLRDFLDQEQYTKRYEAFSRLKDAGLADDVQKAIFSGADPQKALALQVFNPDIDLTEQQYEVAKEVFDNHLPRSGANANLPPVGFPDSYQEMQSLKSEAPSRNFFSAENILEIATNKKLLAAAGVAGDALEVAFTIQIISNELAEDNPNFNKIEDAAIGMVSSLAVGAAGGIAVGTIVAALIATVFPEPTTTAGGLAVLATVFGASFAAGSISGDLASQFATEFADYLRQNYNGDNSLIARDIVDFYNNFAAENDLDQINDHTDSYTGAGLEGVDGAIVSALDQRQLDILDAALENGSVLPGQIYELLDGNILILDGPVPDGQYVELTGGARWADVLGRVQSGKGDTAVADGRSDNSTKISVTAQEVVDQVGTLSEFKEGLEAIVQRQLNDEDKIGDSYFANLFPEEVEQVYQAVKEALQGGSYDLNGPENVIQFQQFGGFTSLVNRASLFDAGHTSYDPSAVIAVGTNNLGERYQITAGEVVNVVDKAAQNGITLDPTVAMKGFAAGLASTDGPENVFSPPTDGTDFNEAAYGFDVTTQFTYGNLGLDTETFGSDFDAILNDGLLINSGNWQVTSITANTPGFFVEKNAAISDDHQPGRSNVIDTTASEEISNLFGGFSAGSLINPSANDIVFSTSYISNWSTDLAEIDPIVLDLDGDGIELTPFGANYLFFDIDNDGHQERTGWVGADDAILVHDLNGNGQIDDITETLSEYYGAAAGTGAIFGTGFEALATLDSNNNGSIDAGDSQFANLRLWRDFDQDGETDAGELSTLDQANIVELSLADTADGSFIGGNEVKSNSTYRNGDGANLTMAAVNFIADPVGLLQEADGAGTRVTLEDGGAVYSVLSEAGETVDAAVRDVSSIIGGIGDDVLTGDAQNNWLVGSLGEDVLDGGAGDDYIVADAADILNSQTNIKGGVGFDIVQFVGDDGVVFNLQDSQVEMAIGTDQADVISSGSSDQSIINGGAGNDLVFGGGADDVLNGEEGDDFVYGNSGDDLIRGHRGKDTLTGGVGNDILLGGLGDDILQGNSGEDLLDGGAGSDRLEGGEGYDVAQYSGSYGDYSVTSLGDGSYAVTDLREDSPDGTDILVDVEALNFADIHEIQLGSDNPMPVKDLVNIAPESDGRTYRIPVSQLLANDIDFQEEALTVREVVDAHGGTVSIDGNTVVFVADQGFNGIPSFSYKISDASNNAGVLVGVTGTTQTAEMTAKVTVLLDTHPDDPQFVDQWYLPEINVQDVWPDYTGAGIGVGVFEVGPWDGQEYGMIDYTHPDLAANIDAEWLRTVNPHVEPTKHATLVAGVIAAARNGQGGVGVAHEATLSGHGMRNGDDDGQNADFSALWQWADYDVANNSWGSSEQFSDIDLGSVTYTYPFGSLAYPEGHSEMLNAAELAVATGRDYLGTVLVFAAGNKRQEGHNANDIPLNGSRLGVTVGAVNAEGDLGNLQIADDPFSNPGSSILVSAPGSSVVSTSRLLTNDQGSTFGDDYETAQGTSFATPIVSGVVALMLEANPELGYRDVQEILALSATRIDDPNTVWNTNGSATWNGGGMHTSQDYGFGLVDARAAVRLAESWQEQSIWSNEAKSLNQSGSLNGAIPDNGSSAYSHSITVTDNLRIENVEVLLDLQHAQMGDLEIILTGPDGTQSILVHRPGVAPGGPASDRGYGAFDKTWVTTTTNHWGEDSAGTWTLTVRDKVTGATGTLRDWELRLYGEQDDENDTYVYTNEFATLGSGSRAVLSDSGGQDILNASAVTGNSVLDLSGEQASSIGGTSLTIAAGTQIEDAYGGDGDDVLIGNDAVNTLSGGRGNDVLHGRHEAATQVTGNTVYLQGDRVERNLTVNTDILSINDPADFYVANTSVGLTFSGGAATVSGSNHFAGFDVNNDFIDLSSIAAIGSFDDLILSNRINFNGFAYAGISTAAGGMILLKGVDYTTLTASNFLFAGQNIGDTLFGGAGNDTLYASTGDDILKGGTGTDTAVFAGNRSDYTIAQSGQGYTVTHNTSSSIDRIDGVELLQFDDQTFVANRAPTVGNVDLGSMAEDGALVITAAQLLQNTTDADGDTMIVTSASVDAGIGTLTDNGDNTWTFTPVANFNGNNVAIAFTVSDGHLDASAQAIIDVTAVNDAPVIYGPVDLGPVDEDTARTITATELLANASDIESDVLSVASLLVAPAAGTLSDNGDDTWTFTPAADFNGTDVAVSYTVSDGTDETSTHAFIDVIAVNDAPVISGPFDLGSVDEDTTRTITAAELLANASDIEGDVLSVASLLVAPAAGTLSDNGDDTWTFTPAADFNGTDVAVSYTVSDGTDETSTQAFIDVTAVNDAPVIDQALADQVTDEDQPWSFTVPANTFADIDGDGLTLSATLADGTALPAWLGFNAATRTFFGTPPQDFNGALDVKVTASDGSASVSDTFTLTIDPVNDAPVIDQALADQATDEDQPWSFTVPANAFADIDGDSLTLNAALADGTVLPSWLTFDVASRTFSGTPPQEFSGALDLKVTASDGSASVSDTFILTIGPVNDAPVISGPVDLGSVGEDAARTITAAELLANASDVEGDVLSVASVTVGAGIGTLTDNGDDTWTFTPAADFNGTDVEVSYTVSDGTDETSTQAFIDVTAVNDAPTGAVTISGAIQTNVVLTTDTSALSDADGLGALSYQWQSSADGGVTWTDIASATARTFMPDAALIGDQLRVIVNYTDDGGTAESIGSDATASVEAGPVLSGEFQISTTTGWNLSGSSVTGLSDGGFVATWSPHGNEIFGQRYDAAGTAIGGEFQVNTYTQSSQSYPSVTGLSGGGFVVTWESRGQDGDEDGIYSQIYDVAGTAVGDEFQVNSYSDSDQSYPSVTGLQDGGFVVTWESDSQDGSFTGIYGQRYDAAGTASGGEFKINTYTQSPQFAPSVTSLAGGGFVVTWTSTGQDGDSHGIYSQIYDATGAAIGDEFQVNSHTASLQFTSSVAGLTDGGFVVAWQSDDQDGDEYGIFAQRYDAAGTAIGGEFQVNTYTTSFQSGASVTGLADGSFVVIWSSDGQDGDSSGIFAQRYDASGAIAGSEFQINTDTTGNQNQPSVTALAAGGFMVTWASAEDHFEWDIIGRRYDATGGTHFNSAPTGAVTISGLVEVDQVLTAVTSAIEDSDGLGPFSYQWQVSTNSGNTWQDIDSATSSTFTPSVHDLTSLLRVVVRYFDGHGAAEVIISSPTVGVGGGEIVIGASGGDILDGSGGSDLIFGDVRGALHFAGGDDVLNGGAGNDILYGDAGGAMHDPGGDDTLNGGDGNDTLYGDAGGAMHDPGGDDTLNGGAGNDTLYGDGGGTMHDLGGNDTLNGGAGDDTLYGDSGGAMHDPGGDDVLNGGTGDDVLSGQTGNDTFVFNPTFGHDIITDFTAGAATDDIIEFAGISGLASYADVLAKAADDGTDTTIMLDTDNTVVLQNVLVTELHSDDFLFV